MKASVARNLCGVVEQGTKPAELLGKCAVANMSGLFVLTGKRNHGRKNVFISKTVLFLLFSTTRKLTLST